MKYLKPILCLLFFSALFGFPENLKAQNGTESTSQIDSKQRSLITLASLTAKGDLDDLEAALPAGLKAGMTVNEIKEVMIHLYAYCGFPRSLRGLRTFIKVLEERKAKGIEDRMGAEASPVQDDRTKYERGKANLEALLKTKLDGPGTDYAQFAPIIEVFLKEHLFADIFDRDVLNYQQRELVTISVLMTIGGVEPMLRSHMNICLIQGLTPYQLEEAINLLEQHLDKEKIQSAREVLSSLLK